MILRDYQIEAIESLKTKLRKGFKKLILFACCGFGKTIVAAEISRLALEKGNKVLFLVHRRLLCLQTKEKFDEYGLHSSIIMAGERTDFSAQIMITTVQTYSRRLLLDDPETNHFFHNAAIIFCDECHLGISPTYEKIYSFYQDKIIIGLTGSPARGDGRPLNSVFDCLLETTNINKLTEQGFISPVRYFAGSCPDLKGVKIVLGDFDKKQLEKKSNTKKLVGDVVENWLKLAENRPTIVFATGVKHSIHLKDQFVRNGIEAEHLDARSQHQERMDVLERFKSGKTKVVTNCNLFSEGYDASFASCVVLAKSTKSLPLYIQMCGRAQRPHKGKVDALLLDHGGNVDRHGFLTDEIEWSLEGVDKIWIKPKLPPEKEKAKCSACGLILESTNTCPDCGTPLKTFGKKIETTDEDLKELKKNKKATIADKRRYLGMLKYWVSEKGYNPRMVNAKYKNYFKCWAHRKVKDVEPIKPDDAFLNLMRHDMIKFAKRKRA